jgi:hypothetical protein
MNELTGRPRHTNLHLVSSSENRRSRAEKAFRVARSALVPRISFRDVLALRFGAICLLKEFSGIGPPGAGGFLISDSPLPGTPPTPCAECLSVSTAARRAKLEYR